MLARAARRGEIGGVIVHAFNFSSADGLRSITTELKRAAAGGGQPLLVFAARLISSCHEAQRRLAPGLMECDAALS